MKKVVKVFIPILFLLFAIACSFLIYLKTMNSSVEVDKRIEAIDLDGVSKLMVVAHPDDETIWGGSHLIDDDYLVVCVTCGVKRRRVIEFKNALKEVNDKYIMLGYPDKTKGQRDNWDKVYDDIYQDLKKIIEYKDWTEIVTHNPDGEYGHIQHQMTSRIVSDIANPNILYYFGTYYRKKNIPSDLTMIGDDNYMIKMEMLISIYKSQKSTMHKLGHMFKYENWVKYNDWNK